MEIQQATECCVAPNKYTTIPVVLEEEEDGYAELLAVYSFFMFRLIICEECPSTI